jgi:phosphatidylinositol kinase/protein kinase (PI-3  family)
MLKKLFESNKGTKDVEKLMMKKFFTIRERFHPVMRHFFSEIHKVPMAWFEMRLKYARSVATTSIVGHVVGLGDRHISNILIDKVSGELIHIDLGIAFDQVNIFGILTNAILNMPSLGPITTHPGIGPFSFDVGRRGRSGCIQN